MGNDNASLGTASLWSSIIGVVLPGCFAVLLFFMEKNSSEQSLPLPYVIYGFVICGFLFVILELVALGCGIAARRTPTGKAGLVISAGIVFLVLLFYLYTWIRFGSGARETAPMPSSRAQPVVLIGGGAIAGGFSDLIVSKGYEQEADDYCKQAIEREVHGEDGTGQLVEAQRLLDEAGAKQLLPG